MLPMQSGQIRVTSLALTAVAVMLMAVLTMAATVQRTSAPPPRSRPESYSAIAARMAALQKDNSDLRKENTDLRLALRQCIGPVAHSLADKIQLTKRTAARRERLHATHRFTKCACAHKFGLGDATTLGANTCRSEQASFQCSLMLMIVMWRP